MSASLKDLLRDAKIELIITRAENDPSIIREIIDNLHNEVRSIRFNATLTLGELGQKAESAVSQLISCLEDEDWSICREATRSL